MTSTLIPRVNAIGLLESPPEFTTSPRRFSRPWRLLVGLVLALFLLGTVVTSVISLGRYCLTTDSTDTRALHTKASS
jgi:hypothetical protein